MSTNTTLGGTKRTPRAIVQIGVWGNQIDINEWVSVEVSNNVLSSADTFRVILSSSSLPAQDMYSLDWFSRQKDLYVKIYMGLPKNPENYSISDLTQYILGQVDSMEFDPVNFTLELTGRDLTRMFIDTKSTEKYPNLTSCQIAMNLARAHGLNFNVAETTQPVGKYYEIDHATMTDEKSDWDLLLYLANIENFNVWVSGDTLNFEPKPDTENADPYVIQWNQPGELKYATANVQTIQFTRALTVTRGVSVIIRSWNQKQAKGFTAYFPSEGKSTQIGKATPFGQGQTYVRTIPNLTQDQADKRAQSLYEQIVVHEMRLSAELPGDNVLDTSSVIRVIGTNTSYDQTYYPDSITRRMDWDGGYSMHVSAKNMSPETQALI